MSEPLSITEALKSFGEYPEDHPQTLQELLEADPEDITHELAWFLRAQAVEVKRSSEDHYINGPTDSFRLLKNSYVLHPWTDKWVSYGLSARRQVITTPHARGGVSSLRVYTPIIPKVTDLPKLPNPATKSVKRPAWLVIFGGSPEVLSKPGVAQGLATLQRRAEIADIQFFHRDRDAGIPPTLWSLRAGVGMQDTGSAGGKAVPFPDLAALEQAKGGTNRDE